MLFVILGICSLVLCLLFWLDYFLWRKKGSESSQHTAPRQRDKFQVVHEFLGVQRLIAFFEGKDQYDVAGKAQEQNTQYRTLTWIKGYTALTALILAAGIYQAYETRQTLIDSQRPWWSR